MAGARRPDGSGSEEPVAQALEQVARQLYALPPEEFTAARTAAVKQARGDGDKALAREVGALRRPALAAWAVNLLVRERAGLVEEVTSMGDSLRQAQAALDGAALRDLNRQRRRLVAAVTSEVGAVAAEHDHPLSGAASRQVEETVQAALVDPRAAAAVRTGLLVQPLTSTGVESLADVLGVPLPSDGVAPDRSPGRSPDRSPGSTARPALHEPAGDPGRPALSLVTEDEQVARRAAQERAAAAEKAARKAAKARDKAVAARAKAQARVLQAEAAVEELRGRLAEAEAQAEEAVARLAAREAAAESAAESAEAAASQAQEAAAAAAATEAAAPG